METNINNSLNTLHDNLKLVRQTNDKVIKDTHNLRMISLNLKIARANGDLLAIAPISDALEKIIISLHDNVQDVVRNHRSELIKAVKDIDEFIANYNK